MRTNETHNDVIMRSMDEENCDDLSSLEFKLCFEDKVYQKENFKNLRTDFIFLLVKLSSSKIPNFNTSV